MKPLLTNTFRILRSKPLNEFCDWLKDAWEFELGFLRTHNGSDPPAHHRICYPLYSLHSQPAFPRGTFFLLDKDKRRKRIANEDPMTHSRKRLEQGGNDLTILQLHHYIEFKRLFFFLHNISQVLLHAMYHRPHYLFFLKSAIHMMDLPPWPHQLTSST